MRNATFTEIAVALGIGTASLWAWLWAAKKAGLKSDLGKAAGITATSIAIGLFFSGGKVPATPEQQKAQRDELERQIQALPRPKVAVIKPQSTSTAAKLSPQVQG